MKHINLTFFPLLLSLMLMVSGGAASVALLPQPDALLRVDGGAGKRRSFTLADIRGLPHLRIDVVDHDGASTYEGVPVEDLLQLVDAPIGQKLHGKDVAAHAVRVTGGDGYVGYFMLPEIDSSFTDQRIIVAYSRDGKPIEGRDGPLQIVVPREKRHARWVRGVIAIDVIAMPGR